MRHFWLLAALAACSGETTDPKGDTDIDTDLVGDSDSDIDTDEQVDDLTSTLTGTLSDGAGTGVTDGLRVQFCRNTACRQAAMEGNVYTIAGIPSGPGSFEVTAFGTDSDLVTVFAPIGLGESETKTVDVTLPSRDAYVEIPATAAALDVADGFSITVGLGMLEAPSPLQPEATHIGGTLATDVGLPIEGLSGIVEALYYMDPFDYAASESLVVTIRNDFGFVDGDAELYAAVYESFSWEKVGDLVDDGAGGLILANGGGVELITTFAVVRSE